MAELNLFEGAPFGGSVQSHADPYTNGTEFYVTAAGWVTQIRYPHHSANVGNLTPRTAAIYSTTSGTTGTMVAGPFTMPTPVRGQWCTFDLPEPFELTPGTRYRVAVFFPAVGGNSSWLYTAGFFAGSGAGSSTTTNGILVRPNAADSSSGIQGSWAGGTSIAFPRWDEGREAAYVDVTVSDADPAGGPSGGAPYSVALPDGSVVPAAPEGVALPDGTLAPVTSTDIV